MNIKSAISKTPQMPGVYFFKNKRGRVLYVGKAANLRARLNSYGRGGWKDEMLREAAGVAWEELSSDIEALICESELIKKLRPYYNILMRDDKNYFFVAFTGDEFPRIFLTHQPIQIRNSKYEIRNKSKIQNPEQKNVTDFVLRASNFSYIGPFTDGDSLKQTLRLLRHTFPYCTCSRTLRHKRKCVNAELGKCLGFCCADIPARARDHARYRANITAIKKVLTGKTRALEHSLTRAMERAARAQRYEKARTLRDQIAALERVFQHKQYLKKDVSSERTHGLYLLKDVLRLKNIPRRIECYDISHHGGASSVASMVVFENGTPAKNEYRKFIIRKVIGINDPAMLTEVLERRLTHREWQLPNLILVDGGKAQLNAALRALKTSDVQWTSDVLLAAIAKREEKLFVAGRKLPFKLKELPAPLLHLITALRDEAHRFAVAFHRKHRRNLVVER